MGNIGTGFGNQGGGGLAPEVIEVTKADFLSLVGSNALTYPATYKITDITAFEGVFINTLSASDFSLNGFGVLIVPDYTASGVNLGQMDANNIPTVNSGEYVIWADHYWINNTVNPVVPTISSDIALNGLSQIAKPNALYDSIQVDVTVDSSLTISYVFYPFNKNFYTYPTFASQFLPNIAPQYCQFNYNRIYSSNLALVKNSFCPSPQSPSQFTGEQPFTGYIKNNSATMNIAIINNGSNNEVSGNVSGVEGGFQASMFNVCRFKDNIATGDFSSPQNCGIAFVELYDNCEIIGNEFTGDGSVMWDVRTGEDSEVNYNIVSGDLAMITNISQIKSDIASNNTLNGNSSALNIIIQNGFSELQNNILSGDNTGIVGLTQQRSKLNGFTLSSNGKEIRSVSMVESNLTNGNDIQLQDCHFDGINIDFTGFTVDIIGEQISGGKGWFAITHDFLANPLASGNSVLYNLIPTGARMTNCTIIPDTLSGGAGATLEIGMESDDVSYGLAATAIGAITNTVVSTISNPATANRSLQLTAETNDITGGTVTVKVEFML